MAGRVVAEVFPPGEYIKDELEERSWTQADLAEILDKPLTVVNEVIEGRRGITPEMAGTLGEAFGTSAQVWLNPDGRYRLKPATAFHTTRLQS